MAAAAVGSSAVWPERFWPLVTVSRFVPSWLISASSPWEDDDDRPSTATIAATPMAMPRADSAARSRRVRSPTLATRARSAGRSLDGVRVMAVVTAEPSSSLAWLLGDARSWPCFLRGVADDAPVEHLDPAGHAGGEGVVVRDDHDGGAVGVELLHQGDDGVAIAAVEIPGRLVGEHDRRAADERA